MIWNDLFPKSILGQVHSAVNEYCTWQELLWMHLWCASEETLCQILGRRGEWIIPVTIGYSLKIIPKKTVTTFCIAWYLCIVTHTITHYISWLKIYLCVGKGFGSFCEHVSVVELMGQLVILYNICSRGRTFKSFHQQIFSWTITWSWVK